MGASILGSLEPCRICTTGRWCRWGRRRGEGAPAGAERSAPTPGQDRTAGLRSPFRLSELPSSGLRCPSAVGAQRASANHGLCVCSSACPDRVRRTLLRPPQQEVLANTQWGSQVCAPLAEPCARGFPGGRSFGWSCGPEAPHTEQAWRGDPGLCGWLRWAKGWEQSQLSKNEPSAPTSIPAQEQLQAG